MTTHSITLFFDIHDEGAFREAASQQALADGLGDADVASFLDAEARSITDCAVMLFDPGLSPAGCTLIDSASE